MVSPLWGAGDKGGHGVTITVREGQGGHAQSHHCSRVKNGLTNVT